MSLVNQKTEKEKASKICKSIQKLDIKRFERVSRGPCNPNKEVLIRRERERI